MVLATGQPVQGRVQEVTHERVAGSVWRLDGAIDVLVAQTGEDGLLLVDTGYPFAEAGVRRALQEIAGTDQPTWIINTHAHHSFSNHVYRGQAQVIAHAQAARRLTSGYLMGGTLVPPMDAPSIPDTVFTDSLSLRINGERISLVHLPGAHTDSDVVVIFHDANVVVAGDVVVPHMPWMSLDEHGSVQELLAALDRLLALVPAGARIVPGHDPVTLDRSDLLAFRSMVAESADSVRTWIRAGWTLRRMQTRGLPHLANWEGAVPTSLFIESLYRSLVTARSTPAAPELEFVNGRWWDGAAFVDRTMYSVAGVLAERRPGGPVETVDLQGGFVVPGFGDAHTHRVSDAATLEADGAAFLEDGVFYVMVQDPAAQITDAHRNFAAQPDRLDVAYTQGVVTPSWGVMVDFYTMMAGMGRFPGAASVADLDGRVLFQLDTPNGLARAWPALRDLNDRFIKVIVAFTDELETRRDDPSRYGANPPVTSAKPGVTAGVLGALVDSAHAAGLQVSAHIETAADFRAGVEAGVDWIAHMPAAWQVGEGTGYDIGDLEPWLLDTQSVMNARRGRQIVVTTVGRMPPDDPRSDVFRRIHTENLETLVQTGATLALGSDQSGSSVDEVFYLRSLGVLPDAQLFRLLAVQTPRLIFPDLKIGHLRDGWEASFLVLGGDPTEDLEHVRDIRLAVKRGMVLPEGR